MKKCPTKTPALSSIEERMLKMESAAVNEKSLEAYRLTHIDGLDFIGNAENAEQAGVAEMLKGLPEPFKDASAGLSVAELTDRHDFETLRETFMNFCESPFNCSKTAGKMHLHRNSLQYRLKKIRVLTGHDPRNIKEAFELWAAFLMTDGEEYVLRTREE